MTQTILGKVSINPRGEWVNGLEYKRLDVVNTADSSYMAINDNQNIPLEDTIYWMMIGRSGKDGVDGQNGRSVIVLPNGNYGNWNDETGEYEDSGVAASATVDLEDVPVSFTEAETKDTIYSGETVPAVFGKLKKWFSSFGSLAWKSKVDYATEIENKPVIPQAQIQSDYNQTDDSRKDFIKNKPTFKTVFDQLITGTGDITPKVIKDINYSPETGDWTFTFADNTPDKIINVPVDNFLNEADYDGTTHILTMYMNDGSIIEVNLEDLIQEYKAAENGGIELVNGNEFKITDSVIEKINRVPKHKTITIPISSWTQSGNYWQVTINDSDVLDDSVIDIGSDESTYQIYKEAAFLPATTSDTSGRFTIKAENQPTDSINLLYSIIL